MASSRRTATISGIVGGVIILALSAFLVLALLGRMGVISILGKPANEVTAVVGSEKMEFFNDPRVQEIFAEHGFTVNVRSAGS